MRACGVQGGDPQAGAIILFGIFVFGFSFVPFIFTRNYLIAGDGAMIVIGFFTYAGILPAYLIFFPILVGAVLTVALVMRMASGHGFGGSGGSET